MDSISKIDAWMEANAEMLKSNGNPPDEFLESMPLDGTLVEKRTCYRSLCLLWRAEQRAIDGMESLRKATESYVCAVDHSTKLRADLLPILLKLWRKTDV